MGKAPPLLKKSIGGKIYNICYAWGVATLKRVISNMAAVQLELSGSILVHQTTIIEPPPGLNMAPSAGTQQQKMPWTEKNKYCSDKCCSKQSETPLS